MNKIKKGSTYILDRVREEIKGQLIKNEICDEEMEAILLEDPTYEMAMVGSATMKRRTFLFHVWECIDDGNSSINQGK